MHNSLDIDIVDFIDLVNHTLSNEFIDTWRFKYSEKFIKHFQIRILQAMSNQKPLKLNSLYSYLTKKCKYSSTQVDNFFVSVDISLYEPLITGKIKR